MVVRDRLDRFHLFADVVDRVPKLAGTVVYLRQMVRDKLVEHEAHIVAHGMDLPEVRDWRWGGAAP